MQKHALKKLSHISQLRLVPSAQVRTYIGNHTTVLQLFFHNLVRAMPHIMVKILILATLTVGSPTMELGLYISVGVLITFDSIEAGTSFIGVAVPPLCTKSSKSSVAPLTPGAFFIPVLARPVSILLEAPSSVDDVYLPLTKLRILAPPEHLFRRKIHFDGPCCRGLGIVVFSAGIILPEAAIRFAFMFVVIPTIFWRGIESIFIIRASTSRVP